MKHELDKRREAAIRKILLYQARRRPVRFYPFQHSMMRRGFDPDFLRLTVADMVQGHEVILTRGRLEAKEKEKRKSYPQYRRRVKSRV